MRFLATRLAAIFAFTWRPHSLTGLAKVIDGDTIVVADELVRLHGIDAPELDQTFWWRGRHICCGTMAAAALEALTAGVKLRCEAVERDRHGRLVAKCFSPNGVDIGRRLVSAGWALAYRHYSTDYVDAEDEARKARRGIWKGTFVKPWEWRASAPPQHSQVRSLNARKHDTSTRTSVFRWPLGLSEAVGREAVVLNLGVDPPPAPHSTAS